MTKISSDHENEIQFFRNHLPCPKILKIIRQNKCFNPPVIPWFQAYFYTVDDFEDW